MISKRELEKMYRRAKNAKTKSPCHFCIANKQKCNDFRPCTRCVRNHLSDLCTSSQATIGVDENGASGSRDRSLTPHIGHPIVFRSHQIDFSQRNPFESVFLKHDWTYGPLRRLYNAGYHAGTLARIADSLPPSFECAVLEAVKSIHAAMHDARNKAAKCHFKPTKTLAPNDSTGQSETDRLAEEDELLWEIESSVGFNSLSLEPNTQDRRSAAVNSCFAENVAGMHRCQSHCFDLVLFFTR